MLRAIILIFALIAACSPQGTNVYTNPASGNSTCTTKLGNLLITGARVSVEDHVASGYAISPIEVSGVYPGRTVFVNVNGLKARGVERVTVGDDLRREILKGGTISASWSVWPSGVEKVETYEINADDMSKALNCV